MPWTANTAPLVTSYLHARKVGCQPLCPLGLSPQLLLQAGPASAQAVNHPLRLCLRSRNLRLIHPSWMKGWD